MGPRLDMREEGHGVGKDEGVVETLATILL